MKIGRFAVLAAALGVGPWSCAAPDEPGPSVSSALVRLAVSVAHREPFAIDYRASGTVRGRNTAVLTSKTIGHVRAVHVRSGDVVLAGQPLAELEASDLRASVSGARAALASAIAARAEAESGIEAAEAAAKLATTTRQRIAALHAERAVSRQDLDDADARERSAVAGELSARARLSAVSSSIEQARAALAESQAVLGYSKIVAPFAGRIIERRVDPGTLASPSLPLFVVEEAGIQRVEAAVEESRIPKLALGEQAVLEIDTLTAPLPGKVAEIVPNVDVGSRAFLVKLDLPDGTPTLRPGTFARAVFRVGVESRLVVPTTAVTRFGALERVFVVEQGVARLRMITCGETQGPWTAVLSGLSEDEHVVQAPTPALRDGTRVEVSP